MKLSKNDFVRNVYYLNDVDTQTVETGNGKQLALNSLKITGRDSKGSRK